MKKSSLANVLIMRKLRELDEPPSLPKKKSMRRSLPSGRPPLPKGKR